MLAERLGQRIDLMAAMMRPDNRPVYHQRLSEPDAIRFWRAHLATGPGGGPDDIGRATLLTATPELRLDIERRMAQANEADGLGGLDGPSVVG